MDISAYLGRILVSNLPRSLPAPPLALEAMQLT